MQDQLPQTGQLVDYKHNTYDFVACLVTSIKSPNLVMCQMDGKISHELNVPYLPARFRPFRTESKCKEEIHQFYMRVKNFDPQLHEENKAKLKNFLKGDLSSYQPSQIISFFRGHNFWLMNKLFLTLVTSKPDVDLILQYIQLFLQFFNKYISQYETPEDPRDIYKNSKNALASCYPEIFINLANISTQKYRERFIRQNVNFVSEEMFHFYYEWFENDFLPTLTTKNLNDLNTPILEKLFRFMMSYFTVKKEQPVITVLKELFQKIINDALKGKANKVLIERFNQSSSEEYLFLKKYIAQNEKQFQELRVKIRLSLLRFKERSHYVEIMNDLRILNELLNNEKYKNFVRSWFFENNIIKEFCRYPSYEPRMMEALKELFFKNNLYDTAEEKLKVLKHLLQSLEFDSAYSFRFFEAIIIHANQLEGNVQVVTLQSKPEKYTNKITEVTSYIVNRPMFGLQKVYNLFRNVKTKNKQLRKEVMTFFQKILTQVVHPQLRQQMVERHISYFLEIFKFDNIIHLEKEQEDYVEDITNYLRSFYEYFKKEDFFIKKLTEYAGTIFKRLPESQKLWSILPFTTEEWNTNSDLIELKTIFLYHDKFEEGDQYKAKLWNSILNCEEKKQTVLQIYLRMDVTDEVDLNWIYEDVAELDTELVITNNIKSIEVLKKFKIEIDSSLLSKLFQMMKLSESNNSSDDGEDDELERSSEYDQLLKTFKTYLDEYSLVDMFEYFMNIPEEELKELYENDRLSQFVCEIWKAEFESYTFERKKEFFLSNFPLQIFHHIENFEKFLQIFVEAHLQREEEIIYINLLEQSIRFLLIHQQMDYKLTKVLLELVVALIKRNFQSDLLFCEEFISFLEKNLYTYHTSNILEILTCVMRDKEIAERYIKKFREEINEPEWESVEKFKTAKKYLKGPIGFIGLRNPHSICYINSFLQQIFHINEFRRGIFATKWKEVSMKSEDLIYQVKRIFLNLQDRQTDAYINQQFFIAFKDEDGQNTPLDVQMDVDEFRNILLDRIENMILKDDLGEPNFVQKIFNGKQSTHIKSTECEHESKREEDFSSICVEVKDYDNLHNSLKNYFKVQMLQNENSYFCEDCQKKVKAEKYMQIEEFPKYLTFVLKRFEYTYSHRLKINSKFQFPFEKFQFCEGQFYSLKGIIVHQGLSEVGHYFSLIKIKGKWYEFNDTYVDQIKQQKVKSYGYGETSTYSNKNAYLLIYKKVDTEGQTEEEFHYQGLKREKYEIQKSNKLHRQMHIYFSPAFQSMIQKLVARKCPLAQSLLLDYILLIKCKIYGLGYCLQFKRIFNLMQPIQSCIIDSTSTMKKVLHFYKNQSIHPSIKGLFTKVLLKHESLTQNFKELLKEFLISLYENAESAQYFQFFYEFSKKDPEILKYLVEARIVGRILEISISNLIVQEIRKEIRQNCQTGVPFGTITSQGKSKQAERVELKHYKWKLLNLILQSKIDLIKQEKEILSNYSERKIKKLFEDCTNKANINQISKFFCLLSMKDEEYFGKKYLQFICDAITKQKSDQLRKYLKSAKDLLKIDDQFKKQRVSQIVDAFAKALESFSQQKLTSSFDVVWQWMLKIGFKNEDFRTEVKSKGKKWASLKTITSRTPQSSVSSFRPEIIKQEEKLKNRLHGLKFPLTTPESIIFLNQKINRTNLLFSEQEIHPNEWQSDEDLTEQQLKDGMLLMRFEQKSNKFFQVQIGEVCGDIILIGGKRNYRQDDSLTRWFSNETQSNKTQLND